MLTLTCISFQKGQFANRHFNDWIDRLYIVYDTFDVEYILSDAAVTTVSGIIALYDKETEQQMSHFKLNSKKVRIIWQTFYQEVPRDLSARGFRVLAYSSGKSHEHMIITNRMISMSTHMCGYVLVCFY